MGYNPKDELFHPFGCQNLPSLLVLFCEYGLSLSLDRGRVGARVLGALPLCYPDSFFILATEILLQAGADPTIVNDRDPNEFAQIDAVTKLCEKCDRVSHEVNDHTAQPEELYVFTAMYHLCLFYSDLDERQ
ncbi:MAG: hypothetical protein J5803_00270 [Desulfovibrio sp.]|nr:hypothetical protein [Desulfovibrio sp.]